MGKVARRLFGACMAIFATGLVARTAQAEDYFKGKTITVLVGLDAGGTVDVFARTLSQVLQKYIPGSPPIVVQNMPGAGGLLATNYLAEKAKPDGLTILWGPWDPLAQAMHAPTLRARYETMEFLGGTGDIRILYGRSDVIPGGLKAPADIAKAKELIVGVLNPTDQSGLLAHLSLKVLGINDKIVMGYRGGNDVFLAMQRGEVQFHSTSIATFRTRNADFVKSGTGMGIAYLAPVAADGTFVRNESIKDMPAFPDLYRQVHGKMPSGPVWEATNWLTNQVGEMTFVGLAPHGTPPEALAELRAAYEAAAKDPDFVQQSIKLNGLPYTFVDQQRGAAIFRSLAGVSPEIVSVLKDITEAK